jgi:hypothetical protein
MKKLLVLALISGIASLASAEINSPMRLVGGDFYDGTFHTVSIEFTEGMSSAVDNSGGYWAIIGVDPTTGSINTDHPDIPEILDLSEIIGDLGDTGFFDYGQGVYGLFATSSTEPWSSRSGIYANNFTIDPPLWLGWFVNLYKLDDALAEITLVDQIYILPEPTTISLLCLGGLMLRRRK